MSVRDRYPAARLPRTHYFVSLSRGDDVRAVALRPFALWTFITFASLVGLWAGGATLYVAFHDDMLGAVISREARMQDAYEERLAESRAEVERVASRQMLDQNAFENKMHDLLSRQAKLEQRGAVVAALAAQAGARETVASADPHPRAMVRLGSALTAIETMSHAAAGDSVIGPERAYAPLATSIAPRQTTGDKPHPVDANRPDLSELDSRANDRLSANLVTAANDPALAPPARLGLIAYSLDRVERGQIATLGDVERAARETATRLGAVIARVGLDASDLKSPDTKGGMGGPFIPLDIGGDRLAVRQGGFGREQGSTNRRPVAASFALSTAAHAPARRGERLVAVWLSTRSVPWPTRPAPWNRPRAGLWRKYSRHPRRAVSLTPARWGATAMRSKSTTATTSPPRYGHMSEVLVEEGQMVKAGDIIGRIGSTGRSTGPHLHYEVRIDGEPVDPSRFLKASQDMAGL